MGGAIGAVSRYLLSGWVTESTGRVFPFGTLLVNVIGCFLLGLIVPIAQVASWIPKPVSAGITVGFLGALTTFSTFGQETLDQLNKGAWAGALANIAANVLIGLAAVWAGVMLGRAFAGAA
ncbi:MAG: fluoride efflux transporter CrcB [Planctomycetes bacterium]|nr:fluoride efflux transporter CrcB [Planctomycetota bacterium]